MLKFDVFDVVEGNTIPQHMTEMAMLVNTHTHTQTRLCTDQCRQRGISMGFADVYAVLLYWSVHKGK